MARVGCGTGAGNSGANSTSNWISPDTNRAPPAYSGGMGTAGWNCCTSAESLSEKSGFPSTSCVWPLRSCVGCRLHVLHVHTKIFVKNL